MSWVYKRTETQLWTVGHYDPSGQWQSESDHGSPEEAAERVNFLNGAPSREAVQAVVDDAVRRHWEDAPHLYPDGSS